MYLKGFLKGCFGVLVFCTFPATEARLINEEVVKQKFEEYKKGEYVQQNREVAGTVFENLSPAVGFLNWFAHQDWTALGALSPNDKSSTICEIVASGYGVGGLSTTSATDTETAVMLANFKDAMRYEARIPEKITSSSPLEASQRTFLIGLQKTLERDLGVNPNIRAITDVWKGLVPRSVVWCTTVLDGIVAKAGEVDNFNAIKGDGWFLLEDAIKLNVSLYRNLGNTEKVQSLIVDYQEEIAAAECPEEALRVVGNLKSPSAVRAIFPQAAAQHINDVTLSYLLPKCKQEGITELRLKGAGGVTDRGCQDLPTSLKILDLSDTGVGSDSAWLARLSNLTHLFLAGTKVTRDIIRSLPATIRVLDLANTPNFVLEDADVDVLSALMVRGVKVSLGSANTVFFKCSAQVIENFYRMAMGMRTLSSEYIGELQKLAQDKKASAR